VAVVEPTLSTRSDSSTPPSLISILGSSSLSNLIHISVDQIYSTRSPISSYITQSNPTRVGHSTLAPSITVCNVVDTSVWLALTTCIGCIRASVAEIEQRASELSASTLQEKKKS
jgi:hypothetical protein